MTVSLFPTKIHSEDAIPNNAPEGHGNGVVTSTYIDLDHAGCKLMLHIHTGVLAMLTNHHPLVFEASEHSQDVYFWF
jgi:hypothetical protein